MNENYLFKLQEDLRLKNFTNNTCNDYYRFVKRFLDYTGKEAMSITYADIRKFIFHMKDNESKKASTINVYTAAIRFFFEYTCHGPRKVRIMCPIENPESRVISAYKRVGRLLKSAHRMR